MYKYGVDTTERVTQFDKLELSFEFKLKNSDDSFRDPINLDENRATWEFESDTGSKIRGQLTSYATEWCSRQHRAFAFTVYIFGSYARFIRWDRSAVVVSERFNYKEESQPLVDFLWRFVHLDDKERGKDTTVRSATPAEVNIANKELRKWKNNNARSVIVFEIQDYGRAREFIGWGSMADAESLTGRATRAYPVWDVQEKKVYFLKDTWRAVTLERESDILRLLNENNVPNVPKLICGGDIEGHTTLSHKFAGNDFEGSPARMPWKCGSHKITHRIHHRFVEDFVGVHLDQFISTHQFMRAVYDAYLGLSIVSFLLIFGSCFIVHSIAHWGAYKLCGILHRDVSGRNVMMTEDGRGILNDWDFAKRIAGPGEVEVPRDHERTVSFLYTQSLHTYTYIVQQGTWQFISTMNLRYPGKQHVVQDDIESFVWVVLYHVLRYSRHSITAPNEIQDAMIRIFDDYSYNNGIYKGGQGKTLVCTALSRAAALGENFMVTDNPALTGFITFALDALQEWHMFVKPPVIDDDPCKEAPKLKSSRNESDLFLFDEIDRPKQDVTPSRPQAIPAPVPFEKLQLRNHAGIATAILSALDLDWPNADKSRDNLPDDTLGAVLSKRSRGEDDVAVAEAPKQKKSKSMGSSMGNPMMTRRSSARR